MQTRQEIILKSHPALLLFAAGEISSFLQIRLILRSNHNGLVQ
jgi:hypothetical protein